LTSPTRFVVHVHHLVSILPFVLGCMGSAGGTGTGGAGTAGMTGQAGVSGSGTAGTSAGPGAGGTSAGPGAAGTTGAAGTSVAGTAGTTGAAGTNVTGRGGTTARGGSTGAAGTNGAGGTGAPQAGTLMGDVTFSVPSQSFKGTLSVGMSTTIAGAQIRYTTDGTMPTASSTQYAGSPVSLTATTQLRAMPFVNGAAGGLVSTALYILRTNDPTSKLPILFLDGYGKGLSTSKTTYLDAAVMIFEPVSGTASAANLPTIASRAAYHLRGQSSASFPQKPYKVELRDNTDADAKYAVLGMPADSDWALIAPYYDRALIRNPFTYTLGTEMGMSAPRTRYVEVYLTGTAGGISDTSYQGIYWLTETIKMNGHRTDLAKLEATDTAEPAVTGGYIFKFDQAAVDAMAPKLTCTMSTGVTCFSDCELVEPVLDTPAPPHPPAAAQLTWITQYVQTFHNTLFTTPLGNYGQYINVASFVDYLIISELTRNVDAYVRSAYFSKDRDGLLMGGPLWDYNFALGVGGTNTITPAPGGTNDGGWQYQGVTAGSLPRRNVNSWFPKLMSDAAFVTQVKARWKTLRTGLLSQAMIEARISMLTSQLDSASVARDFAKWPVSTVLPNGGSGIVRGPSVATWEGQVQAMRDFVVARASWIDTQWQ